MKETPAPFTVCAIIALGRSPRLANARFRRYHDRSLRAHPNRKPAILLEAQVQDLIASAGRLPLVIINYGGQIVEALGGGHHRLQTDPSCTRHRSIEQKRGNLCLAFLRR